MKNSMFAYIRKDVNAGLVVFLVSVPLCLGIALASKAPLMSGILAGVIGGLVVGAFSGSHLGVSGPAAGLVATVIAGIGVLGGFEAFCMATLIAGLIQVLLGVLRAGALASYFPTSVIKGMLAAIGIIILLKQIPHLVGLDSDYEGDLNFIQSDGQNTFTELEHLFDAFTPGPIVIGLASLVVLLVWMLPFVKQNKRLSLIPGPLLAVCAGIGIQAWFVVSGSPLALAPAHMVHLEASANPIEWITLPKIGLLLNPDVWLYGFIVAMIASVESLLCAEATDKIDPHNRIANKNRELVAQGIGNFLAGLFGALPITQVIVRSSANEQAGGQTRLSTMVHGLLILVAVIIFPGVLNAIPMASLAAILAVVGFNLAKPEVFKKYYHKGWMQFVPFIVTIVAVLLTDLLRGVGIGIGVSIFFILRRSFRAPYSYQIEQAPEGQRIVLKLADIVSFLSKGVIIQTLESVPDNATLIVDASDLGLIDPDIIETFEDFAKGAADRGITFQLIGTLDHTEVIKNPTSSFRKEIAGQTEPKR
jgi:MFS superfamily sulfate permease-like transporter